MSPVSSRLLASLQEITAAHPLARKFLVAPDVNYGRELLLALARLRGGWIGWEATTLRGIAESLAFLPLHERRLRTGRDVEIGAVMNRAMKQVIEEKQVSGQFATLADSVGFRRAVLDTLLEVRTAGVTAADIRDGTHADSPAADLPSLLETYERLLAAERLVDPAGLLQVALEVFDREAPFALTGRILLVPTLSTHGLPGALLHRLLAHGADLLEADVPRGLVAPVHLLAHGAPNATSDANGNGAGQHAAEHSILAWLPSPTLPPPDEPGLRPALVEADLFAAATPSDELREVCRRVTAEGLRWDDVEIVATDPDTYGIALDALCQQLGIGATMLQGIPLARTRLGRALDRWLTWIDNGLPADVLRQALEAGEVNGPTGHGAVIVDANGTAPSPDLPSTALARELRRLRIGWGRARYEAALGHLTDGRVLADVTIRDEESDDEFTERRAKREHSIHALAAFLRALLAITPAVPERGSLEPVRTTCAALAQATLGYLELVATHGAAEQQTMARLRTRLGLLAKEVGETESFSRAMAELRDGLSDLRAWPLMTSERKPWSAGGGMPHLTDVTHGGTTGRPRVFVVGLDADRTGASGRQHPLLPDATRRAIARGQLATTDEKRLDRAYRLGASLAALRGRVTLSYATSASLEGREAGPSPLVLQAWRLLHNDPAVTYEALREHLRPPRCSVPEPAGDGSPGKIALLDARDVWLDAIAKGPLLLNAARVVRKSFPMLAAGLDAIVAAEETALNAYHGIVAEAAGSLDPAVQPPHEISPSSLEKLASCPMAWFYRYGLKVHPTDDPQYDEDEWLDALQRGSLLHEVYETFAREYQGRQAQLGTAAARTRVLEIADAAIARYREAVPPPGEAIFAAESDELRQSALAFLQMERDLHAEGKAGTWHLFEQGFGAGEPAAQYVLGDGTALTIRGRVDRVDLLPDGTLLVIDYKTGRATRYARSSRAGPFGGGRHLQPAFYAAAVESLTGKAVSAFEYRFPTERGHNDAVRYSAADLGAARGIVTTLLDHVRRGQFLPTTDESDCRYCDYKPVCRAREDEYGVKVPRADWAKANAPQLPEYRAMLTRRGKGTAPAETP